MKFIFVVVVVVFPFEVSIYTLPHLECIRLVSVRSSLPCINIGVRIELTFVWNNEFTSRFIERDAFDFVF